MKLKRNRSLNIVRKRGSETRTRIIKKHRKLEYRNKEEGRVLRKARIVKIILLMMTGMKENKVNESIC